MLFFRAVQFADFLQTHDVSIELLHRMANVVDLKAPCRTQTLHPFMDVVSRHAQGMVWEMSGIGHGA